MSSRFIPAGTLVFASYLVASLGLSTWAQTGEDVHITPRLTRHSERHASLPGLGGSPDLARAALVSNVNLVLVPVTVTDLKNKIVTGLKKEDFSLYEGDTEQSIGTFYTDDAPLSLGILLDTSKSMSNKIDDARAAAVEFFRQANPQDDFFVVTFSSRPALLEDFTSSLENVQDRLANAEPQGSTAMLDAIYLSIAKMRQARYTRKALLIISDGGDNSSRYTAREIRRTLQESDVQLYALGLFDTFFKTPEEAGGKRLLQALTAMTGGRMLAVHSAADLPDAAAAVGEELRNEYVLGYRPASDSAGEQWRKLAVKLHPVPAQPGLHIHAKSGYYAP